MFFAKICVISSSQSYSRVFTTSAPSKVFEPRTRKMKFSLVSVTFLVTPVAETCIAVDICNLNNCTESIGSEGLLSGLCKCDGSCDLYGDCCDDALSNNTSTVESLPPTGVEFVCRSVYLDSTIKPQLSESFWMVSSCPDNWPSTLETVRDDCVSLSSSLPPITDLDTGTVYANEFCAICNCVENVVAWQPNLACTPYVYDLLASLNFNVQQLKIDPTILQTRCRPCTYGVPSRDFLPRPRPCFAAVSTCANKSHLEALTGTIYSTEEYDSLVDDCVNGPYDLVTDERDVPLINELYRNSACAACNGLNNLPCFSREFILQQCVPVLSKDTMPHCDVIPFTITLRNLGKGQVQVSILSENFTVEVDCPDGQAAVGLNCRPTLCPAGYVESGGRCAFQIGMSNNSSNDSTICAGDLVALNSSDYIRVNNQTVLYDNVMLTIIDFDHDGRPFVCLDNSTSFLCLVALNDTEYTDLSNDTILPGNEVPDILYDDEFGRPIICPPNETTVVQNATICTYAEDVFHILTYISCSLSVIGSSLVLLTYGIFKQLRTLPSLILMNLAAAILSNNLCYIIDGTVIEAFPSLELCIIVAICLHFFVLAQFVWMSIMSFQMARTFYQAMRMRSDSKHQKRKVFGIYFSLGWGIPLLITATSAIVNFTTDHLVLYGVLEDGELGSCFINHFESTIVAFIVPLVLTLIFNMILFVVVTVFIFAASRSSAKVDRSKNLVYLRLIVAVFSVSGLTWIFELISLFISWAWYLFIIFYSTQGFVIFVLFIVTKRIFKLYANLLLCACCKSAESTKTTQSVLGAHNKTVSIKLESMTGVQHV